MKDTGEPPVLRSQILYFILSYQKWNAGSDFLVPLRATRNASVSSLILLMLQNLHSLNSSFATINLFYWKNDSWVFCPFWIIYDSYFSIFSENRKGTVARITSHALSLLCFASLFCFFYISNKNNDSRFLHQDSMWADKLKNSLYHFLIGLYFHLIHYK